ncbi:MAG TPA: hypothetical protein VGK98_18790 [Arthrobacter sp.]|uniref:hypothetical protein n=1 Tax=Arthrobacter sp. TaxID=1667 RepID=UPI002F3F32DC
MGNRVRLLDVTVLRALLLPVLLALAWIIWGAASADAAPGDTVTAGSSETGSLAKIPVAAAAQSTLSAPLASATSRVAPVAKLLPAVPALPAAPSLPATVSKPVTTVAGTVTDTAGAVVNGATTAVTTVAAPVADTVDNLAAAAEDIVSSVAQLPVSPALPTIPSLPIPAVPVPAVPVPSVPVPTVPVPSVSVPAVPVPAVPLLPVPPTAPMPGVTPPAPTPGTGHSSQGLATPAADGLPLDAGPGTATRKAADGARSAAPTATAVTVTPAAADGVPLAGTGLSLAELQMTTPEGREPAGASHSMHNHTNLDALPGGGHLLSFAVSEGTSGNFSSGSEGSGAQAADAAGDWDRTPLFAGARVFDAAQNLPASPAFDPGCSPD